MNRLQSARLRKLIFLEDLLKILGIFKIIVWHVLCVGEDDDDDDVDNDEAAEAKLPSCFDYVMHYLTVFWKVLFAFVPPTGKCFSA